MGFPRQEHWRTLKIPVRGYSWPKNETWVSCIAGRFFTVWATRESLNVSQITHNFKAWNNKHLLSQILWIKMQEQLSRVVLAQGLSWSFSQALGCDLILRFSWGWRTWFQAVSHSRCQISDLHELLGRGPDVGWRSPPIHSYSALISLGQLIAEQLPSSRANGPRGRGWEGVHPRWKVVFS